MNPILPDQHTIIYKLVITKKQLDELENYVQNGRAEYVAGKLIGMLRSNLKVMLNDEALQKGGNK